MAKRYDMHGLTLLCSLLLLLGCAATVPRGAYAQAEVPEFEVDAVSMRPEVGTPNTRLDLYTRIPYTNLTFINTPDGFTASYEVAASIYQLDEDGRKGALVQQRIWENSTVVDAFVLTQSERTYDHTTHAVHLEPGRYFLEFQFTDENTGEVYVREMPVEVRNLAGPLAISDVLLLDDYNETTKTIYPSVTDQVSSEKIVLQLFYEIYADRPQQVHVTREVVPLRKRSSAFIRTSRTLLGLSNDEDEPVEAVYSTVESNRFERGTHQVVTQIPITEFKVGDYLVRVRLEDESGRVLDEVERTFSMAWSGLADHLDNLDEAISQLRYIAKKKELEEIKSAQSYNEQLRRFRAFWDKRDPTPGTTRNERMEEYYYRIAYANQRYGTRIAGWKTDRGQVLVRFGEPDFVERHPHDYSVEPYEIWWYNRIGRKYIFIDKTGFGDYESLFPIWDDRNRIR